MSKKKKQPYIPFYTGDHIKDTRDLSLEAKGAWVDLVLFMWVKESAGMLEGTMADFARMVGASEGNFVAVLNELCRKNVCDVYGDQTKVFKIVCRRLAREAEISEIRREAVENRYKKDTNTPTKPPTKTIQKSDNDIEVDNDTDNGIELKGSGENSEPVTPEVPRGTVEVLPGALVWNDEMYRAGLFRLARSCGVNDVQNLLDRWEGWYVNKFEWRKKDLQEMRLSFESWIKDPKSRINFKPHGNDTRHNAESRNSTATTFGTL